MWTKRLLPFLVAPCVLVTAPVLGQETPSTDEVFQLTAVIGLNNTGLGNLSNNSPTFFSYDISWVDPVLKRYYLADRSNKTIDILDVSFFPPTLTQVVNPGFAGFTGNNDTSGPDGLAVVNNHTEVWVGDNGGGGKGPGQVWVLDIDANVKALPGGAANPIPVGGTTRADEFCANDNLVMVASPAEDPPFLTFISTKTYTVVGKLVFDGGPGNGPNATNGLEQCQWSPSTGKFYQNVPEIDGAGNDTSPGAIAVIDPSTMQVERLFPIPLANCAGPQGMAIGPNNQILEGCNAKGPDGHRNTVVVSATDGSILATFQDLGGADQVWFNPGDGHYIIPSCNTPCRTVPVAGATTGPELLGLVDSSTLQLDQSIIVANQNSDTTVTSGNPRTTHGAAGDPINNQVIIPIPATGGNVPHFSPSLCDQGGGTVLIIGPSKPSSATGCIAVLSAPFPRNQGEP